MTDIIQVFPIINLNLSKLNISDLNLIKIKNKNMDNTYNPNLNIIKPIDSARNIRNKYSRISFII